MPLNNDDIKQLIEILQRGLTDDTSKTSNTKKTTNRKPRKRPNKTTKVNKFENMVEFNMCKEDLVIDQKIQKPQPSARLRGYEPIEARCRICGKTEKVAPNLVESIERYKCNKCSTGAG